MGDVRVFQALSDGTRLEILSVLAAGPINVSKIVARLGCSQPAVSRHLRVLREASLIRDKRRGKEVEYSIVPEVISAAVRQIGGLIPEAPAGAMGTRRRDGGAGRGQSGGSGHAGRPGQSGGPGHSNESAHSGGSAHSGESGRTSESRTRAKTGEDSRTRIAPRRGGSKTKAVRSKLGMRSGTATREPSGWEQPEDTGGRAPSRDFTSGESDFKVARKPGGMDDFLL